MGKVAFDNVTSECQGKVPSRGTAPYGDVLRQESSLADEVLVYRDYVDESSRERILRF